MKRPKLFLLSQFILSAFLFSCGTSGEKAIKIADQAWMVKNLDVSTFRNGDLIPEAGSDEEWMKAGQEGQPAWCFYNNDPANGKKYGKLYNWYAIKDPRGLAPEGWHIPSSEEWDILSKNLNTDIGIKLKSKSGWEYNGNGTNESGFTALPGGVRDNVGYFAGIGESGVWWSATDIDNLNAIRCSLFNEQPELLSSNTSKISGYSVRCVSGEPEVSVLDIPFYEPNTDESEGETMMISSVKIGNQVWMAENLNVITFRNGDTIHEAGTDEDWDIAGQEGRPAWCYYNFDPEYGKKFGKLYNWHAVNDPRGLAPEGWHIPTDEEWTGLTDYLGENAGYKMKSSSGWNVSEYDGSGNGDNSSGFAGLAGGERGFAYHHGFTYSGEFGFWWSATEMDESASYWILAMEDRDGEAGYSRGNELLSGGANKAMGFSVRCISDSPGITRNYDEVLYQLQGKWQHLEDTSNYLVFEKNLKKEIVGGLTDWTVEEFVLSDKCMTEMDKDRFPGGGDEIFITSIQNDMCWGISELTDTTLSLIYIGGRGNINTYRRVE